MKSARILVLAAGSLLLGSCQLLASLQGGGPQGPPGAGQQGPQATPVGIGQVETAVVQDASLFIASLDSREAATIRPQVSGQVTDVFVQLGDPVAQSTPLFNIDAALQQASIASSSAAIEVAEANLEAARQSVQATRADVAAREAELEFINSKAARDQQLFEEGVIVRQDMEASERDLIQAQASLATLEEQILAQEAAVVQAQKALEQAQANAAEQEVQLSYYEVLAPLAGTLGDVLVKAGDYVTPQTMLTTIIQSDTLEVEINIPLERAPQLTIGTPIELLDQNGQVIDVSQISFIAPQANPGTQSVLAKATFANAAGLRASQFIRTRVIWSESPSLVIPFSAVSRLAGQTFVFTVQPNPDSGSSEGPPSQLAVQRPVRLGELQGNQYQVLDGVSAGEEIVVSGLQKIFNEAPIINEELMQQGGPGGPSGPEDSSGSS